MILFVFQFLLLLLYFSHIYDQVTFYLVHISMENVGLLHFVMDFLSFLMLAEILSVTGV